MRRSGERRKREKEKKRRIRTDQTSFWASLGSIGAEEEEASDILDYDETRLHSRRRITSKEQYNKYRYVNRATKENDENIEEESRGGMRVESMYQNSNLMLLLNILSKENKVSFTILFYD